MPTLLPPIVISRKFDEEFNHSVKRLYAQKSGIDINDPGFWNKLDKWEENYKKGETHV